MGKHSPGSRFWQKIPTPMPKDHHEMDYGFMGYDPVTTDESAGDEVKLKDVEFDMMINGVSYKVKGKTLASCTQFDEVSQ